MLHHATYICASNGRNQFCTSSDLETNFYSSLGDAKVIFFSFLRRASFFLTNLQTAFSINYISLIARKERTGNFSYSTLCTDNYNIETGGRGWEEHYCRRKFNLKILISFFPCELEGLLCCRWPFLLISHSRVHMGKGRNLFFNLSFL